MKQSLFKTFYKFYFLLLGFIPCLLFGQADTNHVIKVHFLYGSKPLRKYKQTEFKFFGGLHGGHISIQVDSTDYGFVPTYDFHVFSHRKKLSSEFIYKNIRSLPPYPKGSKFVTFVIPVTETQYEKINSIHSSYTQHTPYDYAFFGMRCAAATQDILGQIGIVKPRRKLANICSTFYPKKLRKRMFKLAKEKQYEVVYQEGRKTRKWEKD